MAVRSCSKITFELDRRFWALDHDQSMSLLRLYDEGRSLMTSYRRKTQEITTNTKIVLSEFRKNIDNESIDRASTLIPNEADGLVSMAQEGQLMMSGGFTHTRLEMELRAIDKQLDDIATKCSEIQLCPALVQPILSTLPRELRDYIYDLLWSSHDIKCVDKVMSSVPAGIRYQNQPAVHLPDLPVPIFANPSLVGTEFAAEFALRYVRALTAAEIDHRCVRAHLNRDRFGSLHFPFKRFINCLTITVGCDSFGFIESFAEAAWRDSLDALLTLKDDRSIKIIIYLSTWMQYRVRLFEVLEVTRPFFYKFRENSMNVKVFGYDFFNPIEDDTGDIYSEQLNHYFDRTPEEWLDMKAKEIKEIPDAKQRRACKGVRNPGFRRNPS
ncbi:uncharacterized protein yc1106_07611 [Curvularia clavata]|uniref:Uncharacterized protein n=1 Tax=Curvularia clavata TaxID=95742 RepID=A0A9Q8ZBY4_CURCL|nr:uncharacterized protein yc1106_07611 [Curvularia clavata]